MPQSQVCDEYNRALAKVVDPNNPRDVRAELRDQLTLIASKADGDLRRDMEYLASTADGPAGEEIDAADKRISNTCRTLEYLGMPPAEGTATPAATEAEEEMGNCLISPSEVKDAFAEFIGSGDVTLKESGSPDVCLYTMPVGSLALNGHGTPESRVGNPTVQISRIAYNEPTLASAGGNGTKVSWGGPTPEAVFMSADKAFTELATTAQRGAVVKVHPELGAGAVWDGAGTIVLAAEGEHWYTVTIILAKGDASYEEAMVALAESINAKAVRG